MNDYGIVKCGDGEFICSREDYQKGLVNTYKAIFEKLWGILQDDDRIRYIMFLNDENLKGTCIQLWLHRGTVFSPGPIFEEDHSNDNSVIAEFLGKWLQVPRNLDEKEQYRGVFNGKKIAFNREYAGYRFTDEECKRLLDGEQLIVTLTGGNGKQYQRAGKLGEGEYGGFKYYGFIWDKSIKLCPLEFARHKFTDEELKKLNDGQAVLIEDLWSEKKQKYFKRRLVFNKDLGKIEFAETYNYGNGDVNSIGV